MRNKSADRSVSWRLAADCDRHSAATHASNAISATVDIENSCSLPKSTVLAAVNRRFFAMPNSLLTLRRMWLAMVPNPSLRNWNSQPGKWRHVNLLCRSAPYTKSWMKGTAQ